MANGYRNIWYVAHYAGGPGVGRHSRGWYLARTWQQNGGRATIIAANCHHMLDRYQDAGARNVEGVAYHFLPTPSYHNNGLMRVVNMFAFTAAFYAAQRDLLGLYGKPDAIVASSPHPFIFVATHRLARSIGAKSILEVRDLWPASMIDIMNLSILHPIVTLTASVERYAYTRADSVISLLPQTEGYMRSRGLRDRRWHYIPNGVVSDEMSERPLHSPIFDRIDNWHAQGLKVVCYTGALGIPNNLGCLLDAMVKLKYQNAPVRALIVGKGDVQDELRESAVRLGLQDHVYFHEQVPKSIARAIQECCDVGFIALKPSPVFRFGVSPNKIFDYMMSSLPVVSSIEAGNDIVSDVGCGVSVPSGRPHDVAAAIWQVACLPRDEHKTLGLKGRDFVEANHDYKILAQQYMDVIFRPEISYV